MLTCCNNKQKILHAEYLSGPQIHQVNSAKYFGVTIDQHLTWKDHINNICHKVNSIKGFLRLNLHQCPTSTKSNCYKIFVRSILEYAATVWSPYLQYQIYQLDKVQRSAARFVMNNFSRFSSVTSMLNHLSWPALEQRRKIAHGVEITH